MSKTRPVLVPGEPPKAAEPEQSPVADTSMAAAAEDAASTEDREKAALLAEVELLRAKLAEKQKADAPKAAATQARATPAPVVGDKPVQTDKGWIVPPTYGAPVNQPKGF